MLQGDRERLARIIDNTFFAHYDGGRPGQACLYWAHYAVEVLTALGIRTIIQAGSASWPRVRPDQDDGVSPTHHSYVWEPDSAVTKARLAVGDMPEMHVWARELPDGVIYAPDMQAIRVAMHLLNGGLP